LSWRVTAPPATAAPQLSHDDLGPGLRLGRLIDRATRFDGHPPFGEHILLTLDGRHQLEHAQIAVRDRDALGGFCVLSKTGGAWYADLVVDPDRRGQGVGSSLFDAAIGHVRGHGGGTLRAWGRPDGAAAATARRLGMTTHRTLLFQRRPHDVERPSPAPSPAGVRLRSLRSDEFATWLTLSNAAFAGHPENGGWRADDLAWRLAAPWTDLRRFVVAVDDGDAVLAGVWTKVEPGSAEGELFVVAVHPDHERRGLGRLVTVGALQALHDEGLLSTTLYVDESNQAACRLYSTLGFATDHVDRCYTLDVSCAAG